MSSCHSNRFNSFGYLDLNILSEYAEYANNLCEFILNTIVLDYVVRTSIRNYKSLLHSSNLTSSNCISLYRINLDTDFLSYEHKMKRICAMSKTTFYDIKTARLTHPSWIVRFSPNFKQILRVFSCNLRNLVKKINDIEGYVAKANLKGEIARYHTISAALTTVKYDLLTLYVTIRSGGLTVTKTSFLYPILSDTQRWLTYTYYQIKQILSSFPGSNENQYLNKNLGIIQPKKCIQSLYMINDKLKKTIEKQIEIDFDENS